MSRIWDDDRRKLILCLVNHFFVDLVKLFGSHYFMTYFRSPGIDQQICIIFDVITKGLWWTLSRLPGSFGLLVLLDVLCWSDCRYRQVWESSFLMYEDQNTSALPLTSVFLYFPIWRGSKGNRFLNHNHTTTEGFSTSSVAVIIKILSWIPVSVPLKNIFLNQIIFWNI